MSNTIAAYTVQYDIPEGSGIANPTGAFRRLGFRSSLSVWVIPECKMPWSYLKAFRDELKAFEPDAATRARRGKCRWIRSESSADDMREYARESVEEEIQRLINQARQNLTSAQADYGNENKDLSPAEFQERVEAHLAKRRQELEDTLLGASNFDVNPASLPHVWARTEIDAIEQRCQAQAKSYAEAAAKARQIAGDGEAMANAIEDNAVPPGVIADFLDDQGHNEGQALRDAFREEIGGPPTIVETEEDCTVEPTEAQDEWGRLPWELETSGK